VRTLCASTLIGEFFVIGFAGLVAMKSDDLTAATVWTVCGVGMLLSVLLCGVITRPGGIQLGWALQAALVLSGFFVPMMFILGLVFGGLWWASVHYGRLIDEAKARWAAQEAGEAAASG
jgi:thiol:disulfide interchange protein